jgi:hypothetical protein
LFGRPAAATVAEIPDRSRGQEISAAEPPDCIPEYCVLRKCLRRDFAPPARYEHPAFAKRIARWRSDFSAPAGPALKRYAASRFPRISRGQAWAGEKVKSVNERPACGRNLCKLSEV